MWFVTQQPAIGHQALHRLPPHAISNVLHGLLIRSLEKAHFAPGRMRMPTDVVRTLRGVLAKLSAERQGIDRKIIAVREALHAVNGLPAGGGGASRRSRRAQRRMSPAARRAVSKRMKAYWAKRRAKTSKGKRTAA